MPYEYFQGTPGAAAQRLRRQVDALSDCRGPHVFDAEDVRLVLEYLEANERARLAEAGGVQPAMRTVKKTEAAVRASASSSTPEGPRRVRQRQALKPELADETDDPTLAALKGMFSEVLRLRSPARLGDRALVDVSVADGGEGVPPERLPHLFRRHTGAREGGGSGLGLVICKGLVEAHGGRIREHPTRIDDRTPERAATPSAAGAPAARAGTATPKIDLEVPDGDSTSRATSPARTRPRCSHPAGRVGGGWEGIARDQS